MDMKRRYVSDIIGDDYKGWKTGDRILIETGTGSGKTYFVLNTLLRHAKAQGKHLVYFCNRKYLSLQVQAAARKLLLDELGEDREGLAAHLHIRTYQHSELAFDYPSIKAVDPEGGILWDQYEVRARDVLYYVFDEAFYPVFDAGVNPNTHHWYDQHKIINNQDAISVFLAATPEPLMLFLEFQEPYSGELMKLCSNYVAMHFIREGTYRNSWICYYYPPYLRLEEERDRWFSVRSPWYDWNLMMNQQMANGRVEEAAEEIVKECANPYRDFFSKVERAYQGHSEMLTRIYRDERSLQDRYAYLDTHYYDDMAMLAKVIASSVKKNQGKGADEERVRWLVFVRSFEEANGLRTSLRTLDCASVAISSRVTGKYDGSPCKRKGTVKKTLETLIHQEKLDCDVLITTSVLDCGVSLRAENVNNLAVCQPDKTSFLQMIGRIRVREGQRVNLYIQHISPKKIKGYRDHAEDMLLYLAQLYIKDEQIHKSILGYGQGPDFKSVESFMEEGMVWLLPTATRKKLLERMENDPKRKHYLYDDDRGVVKQSVPNDRCYKLNPMAILHHLSQVYYMKVQLPEYNGDPNYFLKEQLSWIGKDYDPACWIDYDSSREQICSYLAEVSEQEPMDKQAQLEFRKKCYEYLCCLRNPPEAFRKTKSRRTVGSGSFPGMRKLNEIFIAAGIPYQIDGDQNKKQLIDRETGQIVVDSRTGKPKIDNKTYWFVIPVDVEELRSAAEQKQAEKQQRRLDRQEAQRKQKEEKVIDSPQKQNSLKVVIKRGDKEIPLFDE